MEKWKDSIIAFHRFHWPAKRTKIFGRIYFSVESYKIVIKHNDLISIYIQLYSYTILLFTISFINLLLKNSIYYLPHTDFYIWFDDIQLLEVVDVNWKMIYCVQSLHNSIRNEWRWISLQLYSKYHSRFYAHISMFE